MDVKVFAKLCYELMDKYSLRSNGWKAKFDNAAQRAGQCNYRTKMLSFSRYYVEHNDEAQVKDTILHEIAHALTPGHKHDYIWMMKCIEIGCKPKRCTSIGTKMPEGKFQAVCPTCNNKFHRHRESKHLVNQNLYCRRCGPNFGKLKFVAKGI